MTCNKFFKVYLIKKLKKEIFFNEKRLKRRRFYKFKKKLIEKKTMFVYINIIIK